MALSIVALAAFGAILCALPAVWLGALAIGAGIFVGCVIASYSQRR